MHCTKCGAEIAEGSKFCTGCGATVESFETAEVETAEVETAEEAEAAEEAVETKEQSSFSEKFQKGANAAGAAAGAAASATGAAVASAAKKAKENEYVAGTLDIIKYAFVNPATAAESVMESGKFVPGIVVMAIQLVLVLVLGIIHYPCGSNDYIDGGNRVGCAFICFLAIAAAYAIEAIALLVVGDKSKKLELVPVLSALGSMTIYSTCLFIIGWLFGTFTSGLAGVCLDLSVIVYAMLSSKFISDNLEGDGNKRIIKTTVITAIAFVVYALLRMLASYILWQ